MIALGNDKMVETYEFFKKTMYQGRECVVSVKGYEKQDFKVDGKTCSLYAVSAMIWKNSNF